MLTPQTTYIALLVVQALHLLRHRLTKRHISFAEVVSAIVLCVPPWSPVPAWLLMGRTPRLDRCAGCRKCLDKKLSPNWSR